MGGNNNPRNNNTNNIKIQVGNSNINHNIVELNTTDPRLLDPTYEMVIYLNPLKFHASNFNQSDQFKPAIVTWIFHFLVTVLGPRIRFEVNSYDLYFHFKVIGFLICIDKIYRYYY